MTPLEAFIGHVGTTFLVVTSLGIVVRRRYRVWPTFGLYVAFLSVYALLIALWPGRFHRPAFWIVNESVASLLRFAVALELAFRTFRHFPGALARLRVVLLAVIGATLMLVVVATPARLDYTAFVGQIQPRILNGAVWLFSAIAVLILWYRLPILPFYKKVLLSYVPYLLVFTVAMNVLGAMGWERGQFMSYLNQLAYVVLVAFWAHTAWQPVRVPTVEPVHVPLRQPV